MEATPDPSHIKALVRNFVAETREVAARNRTLETQMEASSKQMESLQVSVRQATLEAVTDGLTGLANRRHFDRLLSRQVTDAEERAAPLCLIMCDIDHFKRINDAWGHPVGDQVIRYVASAIQAAAAKPACGARYGGEEFALLLPRTNLDAAETIAQELLRRVRARTLSRKSSGELIKHITLSAGVALLRPGERAEALLRRADAALYEAKRAGRDRVICESENRAAA
jgi:diguanylate cyclase